MWFAHSYRQRKGEFFFVFWRSEWTMRCIKLKIYIIQTTEDTYHQNFLALVFHTRPLYRAAVWHHGADKVLVTWQCVHTLRCDKNGACAWLWHHGHPAFLPWQQRKKAPQRASVTDSYGWLWWPWLEKLVEPLGAACLTGVWFGSCEFFSLLETSVDCMWKKQFFNRLNGSLCQQNAQLMWRRIQRPPQLQMIEVSSLFLFCLNVVWWQ